MDVFTRPPHEAYRLEEWLAANKHLGRTPKWLAAQLHVTEQALSRYFKKPGNKDGRIPNEKTMQLIYVVTDGQVQPNSFYRLPNLAAVKADKQVAA